MISNVLSRRRRRSSLSMDRKCPDRPTKFIESINDETKIDPNEKKRSNCFWVIILCLECQCVCVYVASIHGIYTHTETQLK